MSVTSNDRHTCPRRLQDLGPWERREGLDGWRPNHLDSETRVCDFCGSMDPIQLMERVRSRAVVLGPTDKTYKVYVHLPLTDEDLERHERTAEQTATRAAEPGSPAYEEMREWWVRNAARTGSGKNIGKFYFQHFTEQQKREFVELHNSGVIQIGYPGRFYVLPYFMRPVEPDAPES